MAAATQILVYNQRQLVVVYTTQSAIAQRRFQMPYAKELMVSRGVDNVIEFTFVNQEEKPVDITGKEITCRILNYTGTTILLQKTLTAKYSYTGIAQLVITKSELMGIEGQFCYYSIEYPQPDVGGTPAYVDASGGARGTIRIQDAVFPSFTPSQDITIPSLTQYNPNTYGNNSNTSNSASNVFIYYSSIINTVDSPVLTIQTTYQNYTGNVQIQGCTTGSETDPGWYNIGNNLVYTNFTSNDHYIVEGYHPYVRLLFTQLQGNGMVGGASGSWNGTTWTGTGNKNDQFYDFYGPNGMGPNGNGQDAWVANAQGNDYGGNSGGSGGGGDPGNFPSPSEGKVTRILAR